jgi:hypothetical protein
MATDFTSRMDGGGFSAKTRQEKRRAKQMIRRV